MIGSELANHTDFLLNRARSHLGVETALGGLARRLASTYVSFFGIPEIGLHLRIREALRCFPHDAKSAVDVGCGTGTLIGQIHRRVGGCRLVGIEPDACSCDIAAATHAYAEFINTDAATAAKMFQESFDVVFSLDVLQFLKDPGLQRFFEDCYRMLKRGGRLILHAPTRRQRRHLKRYKEWGGSDYQPVGSEPQSVQAMLARAGFASIKISLRTGYLASLAWEWNMAVAGTAVHAVCFPVLLSLAVVGESLPSASHNTFLCEALRPA